MGRNWQLREVEREREWDGLRLEAPLFLYFVIFVIGLGSYVFTERITSIYFGPIGAIHTIRTTLKVTKPVSTLSKLAPLLGPPRVQ